MKGIPAMKKDYVYAVTAVLFWSTTPAITKWLIFDIPNMEALSISSFFAFIFLLLMNTVNGTAGKWKHFSFREYMIMIGLGFIGLFLYSVLYYYGLSQLSSQEACILNYLWPMMLVIFSCPILKEKMSLIKIAAMGCSFMGILILSAGGTDHSYANAAPGMISCILAAACYGLFSVLNKKARLNQNAAMMMFWLTSSVCSLILGAVTETWIPIHGIQWAGLLWLGIAADAAGYLLWALALKGTDNTASIANLAYLTPVLSLIVSAVFLKEKIQPQAAAALAFIIGGIVFQGFAERRQA